MGTCARRRGRKLRVVVEATLSRSGAPSGEDGPDMLGGTYSEEPRRRTEELSKPPLYL